jgi:hypothetical protein
MVFGLLRVKVRAVMLVQREFYVFGSLRGDREHSPNSSLLDMRSFDSLFARSGWFSAYFAENHFI